MYKISNKVAIYRTDIDQLPEFIGQSPNDDVKYVIVFPDDSFMIMNQETFHQSFEHVLTSDDYDELEADWSIAAMKADLI